MPTDKIYKKHRNGEIVKTELAPQECQHRHCVDAAGSLLEWANEEGAKVYWTDYPIADTGDWSTVWTCETEDRKGYGHTFADSIEDAMKEATDPTKWDYVPDFEAENTSMTRESAS